MTPEDRADLVSAAQRVAGLVAARGRRDAEGARELMCSFSDERELATGALLVAELSLGLLSRSTGDSLEECSRNLAVEMESALATRP